MGLRCSILVAIALALLTGRGQADDPAVQRLIDPWTKPSAINTGRVKGLHLTLSSHTPDNLIRAIGGPQLSAREEQQADAALKRSLSPEEFGTFFDEVFVNLAPASDSLPKFQQRVATWMAKTGRQNGQQVNWTCSRLAIVKDGDHLKNDEQYLGNRSIRSQRGRRFASYDSSLKLGELSGDDNPNAAGDRLSIEPWMFSIEALRHSVPSDAETLKQLKQMKLIASADGEESRLVGPESEVTFQTQSGFVLRAAGLDEAGKLAAEIRYARPRQAGGGVELANACANVQYTTTKDGEARLASADFLIVESAEINVKIAPGELVVPVPRGTLIREGSDFGDSPLPSREFTTRQDVPDLMTVAFPTQRQR